MGGGLREAPLGSDSSWSRDDGQHKAGRESARERALHGWSLERGKQHEMFIWGHKIDLSLRGS